MKKRTAKRRKPRDRSLDAGNTDGEGINRERHLANVIKYLTENLWSIDQFIIAVHAQNGTTIPRGFSKERCGVAVFCTSGGIGFDQRERELLTHIARLNAGR